ncbi:MAG: T9SS type A sorting domain-containing protein, partial [Bacteroidia bacterium]|nr:T9SS type A sorting domain-containing protein [Bacteroidia bacterium]
RTCVLVVNKSSGALTPAGGTTVFAVQGFTQTLGDFTAPSGTFYIGGRWTSSTTIFTHSAGTFTHNNGNITFDSNSGCTWPTITIDVLPTTLFYDLTMNSNGGCGGVDAIITTAAGDTINTTNNLVFTDGAFTGISEGRKTVTVQSTFDGGSGTLLFTGTSGDQNFDLTGATGNFNGPVKINKTSGNVVLQSVLLMDGAGQTLTFMTGNIISTSTNMLQIGDGVTVSGASNASYTDGQVRKIGNDAFTFPVGKGGYYAAIAITAPSVVTDHFTAEYFSTDPHPVYNNQLKDASLEHISHKEYWILNRTNGTSNVSVTLSWLTARSGDVTNLSTLRVARWDGSLWRDHGNGGTTGNTAAGTIISSAVVTSFSPFTLASTTTENPLPIDLLSFTAKPNGNFVDVKWSTATETNNDYFNVERSADRINTETIATVNGAGNSSTALNYFTVDESPLSGVSYYRLKQTDFDGKYKYYNWVAVNFETTQKNFGFDIYPNPANPNTGVSINLQGAKADQPVIVVVYDELGKEVLSKIIVLEKNNTGVTAIDPSSTLASGIYIISATSDNSICRKKLIIR